MVYTDNRAFRCMPNFGYAATVSDVITVSGGTAHTHRFLRHAAQFVQGMPGSIK